MAINIIGTLETIAVVLGIWKLYDLVQMYQRFQLANKRLEMQKSQEIKP